MAHAGAALFLGEGFLALLANAAGGGDGVRTAVVGAVALAAVAISAIVFFAHERLTRTYTHAIAATGALLIACVVAVERPVYAMLYVWLVFFVASFFRPRATALHVLWMLACAAGAIWTSDPVGRPAEAWLLLAGTLGGSATLVSVVRRYLSALAERERESRAVLDTVFGSAPVGLALFDRDLRYARVNELFASWGALSVEEHVGLRIDDVHPGVGPQVEPLMQRVFETGEPELGILAHSNGRVFRSSRYPITDPNGKVTMVASIVDDVTELMAAQERVTSALAAERETTAFLDALLEHAPLDLAFVDTDLVVQRVNRSAAESSGMRAEEMIGRRFEDVYPELADTSTQAIRHVLETGEAVLGGQLTTESPPGSGRMRHWLVNRFQVRDRAGTVLGVTSTRTDVTELKLAEARLAELLASERAARREAERVRGLLDEQNRALARQARLDVLTGVANRPAFSEHLAGALAGAERDGSAIAVLYLDLDGFKDVNDEQGHATGDRLLGEIAMRLLSVARENDLVARIGGDEFVIVLSDLPLDRAEAIATTVADRVHDAIGRPLRLGTANVRISASVGIALYPRDAGAEDALVNAADSAMYESKRAGRSRTAIAGRSGAPLVARGGGRLRPTA
jgi:diguanylate cyclase (GGDEF)-like protein/PAS domain S-box-containing protein